MDLLFCPECGSKVEPTDHTCSYCGFNLDKYRDEKSSKNKVLDQFNEERSRRTPPSNQTPPPQKPKKIPRLAIIIIIAVVVIALVGTLVALKVHSASEEKEATSTSSVESKEDSKTTNEKEKTDETTETEEKEEETATTNTVTNKVETVEPETIVEPKPETTKIKQLNFGEVVTLDFVQFSIDSSACATEINPSETDGYYRYKSAGDGEKFLYLKGTIKNIGGESFEFTDSTTASVTFDDQYTYTAYVTADEGDSMSFIYSYLDPLESTTFYIYASVPDELIQTYKYAVFTFGFHDNFYDYYDKEPNNVYSIKVTK